jgi:four helix bundle protein
MQDFRNLEVWQKARRLTKLIYQVTTDFPPNEEFGLKAQMRRASVSICANIAEGCGRRGDREFRRFLDVAMGSASELECETILGLDLALLSRAVQEQMLDAVIQIKRMLGGLMGRLDRRSQSEAELMQNPTPKLIAETSALSPTSHHVKPRGTGD